MSQTYHILNGDALLDFFPESILSGEIIVARECLVDGPQDGETPEAFWETRANFIAGEYGEEKISKLFLKNLVYGKEFMALETGRLKAF